MEPRHGFLLGLAVLALLVMASPAWAADTDVYVIRDGDTLIKIAGDHGMTVEQLIELNPELVATDYVAFHVGRTLRIPAREQKIGTVTAKCPNWYTVVEGDSLDSIAAAHDLDIDFLNLVNHGIRKRWGVGIQLCIPTEMKSALERQGASGGTKVPFSLSIAEAVPLRAGPSLFHVQKGTAVPDKQTFSAVGRNTEGTWLAVQAVPGKPVQWIPIAPVVSENFNHLPAYVSQSAPDTELLFDFLLEQTLYRISATGRIEFEVQSCGQENAFAITVGSWQQVVVCQELLLGMWETLDHFKAEFPSPLEYTVAATSAILAVVLHEYAHLVLDDSLARGGLDTLGETVAWSQRATGRYGPTFTEDIADLYATVFLIELAGKLDASVTTRGALPSSYVAAGPILMGYTLDSSEMPRWMEMLLDDGVHSLPHERLGASLCAVLDGAGPDLIQQLNRMSELHAVLLREASDPGRICLQNPQADVTAYATLKQEIETYFAGALPDWWYSGNDALDTATVQVNTAANLRAGPGTDHAIVGGRQRGDRVKPVARTPDGQWLRLANGSWIYASLVDYNPVDLPIVD